MAALERNEHRSKPKKLVLDMKHHESLPMKPSTKEASKLKIKALPHDLRYMFMGRNDTLSVIIAVDFNAQQVECSVAVFKRFKRSTGWTNADIIGISLGICSHNIKLMPYHILSIKNQIKLNPPTQEVVKNEIIKLLDVGVICTIADNS